MKSWRHFSRLWVRILAIVVLLGAVIAAWRVIDYQAGEGAWLRYRAEAKQRRGMLDFADFVPPEIPDAENFAAIPLFQERFAGATARGRSANPFGGIPKLRQAVHQEEFAAADLSGLLAIWRKRMVKAKLLTPADFTQDAAVDVLRVLEKFAPELNQVQEAGRRPKSRFSGWEDPLHFPVAHVGVIQDLALLHELKMLAHLALGQRTEALNEFRGGVRLYRALRTEPTMLHGYLRNLVLTPALSSFDHGLAAGAWTEDELAAAEAELSTIDLLADWRFAMASERAWGNAMLEQFRQLPPAKRLKTWGRPVFKITDPIRWLSDSQIAVANCTDRWVYENQLLFNRCTDDRLAMTEIQASDVYFEDLASVRRTVRGSASQNYFTIARTMFSFTSSSQLAFDTSSLRLTRLAIALERFHAARGEYPAALQELAPAFLSRLPKEVWADEEFRYRRLDNGTFLLYSIGKNRVDDCGKINPKRHPRLQKDWVWGFQGNR